MERKELVITLLIVAAMAASRLIPHAPNITSTLAGLIFGGAVLRKGIFALFILAGYYVSDLLINNILYAGDHIGFQWTSQSFYWIYTAMILIFLISRMFTTQIQNPFGILAISLSSSVLFFLMSNFGVWMEKIIYVNNMQGLSACYVAALPFFSNEVAATLFFTCIFFGVYWLYGSLKNQDYRTSTAA